MGKKNNPTIFGLPEPVWLQKISLPNWMFFVLTLIFIFRIPSLLEPYYYGDEMIYLTVGQGLKQGLVLYRDIFDHKTPFIYYLSVIAGNLFWMKFILLIWMIGTTVAFYKLVSGLFPKNNAVIQASVASFAILTTIPLLEGNIVNAELFMIGPAIFAFYLLLSRKHTPKLLVAAGVLLGISALFKIPAIFEIGVISCFWLITRAKKKSLKSILLEIFTVLAGVLIPFAIFVLWFSLRGALDDFIFSVFTINLSYITSWGQSATDSTSEFLPLITRGLLVLLGLAILYFFRNKLSKPFIFACIWLLIAIFASTLSGRPYPHYLIQTVPAISILIGMLIAFPSLEQSLTIVPLLLVIITIKYFGFWYYPTTSYYTNFIQFATGSISKTDYYRDFSVDTRRNYELAAFLKSVTNPGDPVFVWGDSPVVYALSNRLPHTRFVADYHIGDFSNLNSELELIQEKVKYIVIMPDANEDNILKNVLKENYLLIETIEGAKIYKSIHPLVLKM